MHRKYFNISNHPMVQSYRMRACAHVRVCVHARMCSCAQVRIWEFIYIHKYIYIYIYRKNNNGKSIYIYIYMSDGFYFITNALAANPPRQKSSRRASPADLCIHQWIAHKNTININIYIYILYHICYGGKEVHGGLLYTPVNST